jgi:hypothetical protein
MKKIFQIITILCPLLFLACCDSPPQPQKRLEQVKLEDLTPPENKLKTVKVLSFANFQILIFEMPSDNVSKLDEISKILYLQSIKFNNFNAFSANSFSTGLGRMGMGDKVLSLLANAGGKRTGTISLLLNDGQEDDVPINRTFSRNEIFYTAADGTTQSALLGPGILALRIRTAKDPAFKGVCNVLMTPVHTFPTAAWPAGDNSFRPANAIFQSCSMSMKMTPGDFIFLRPQKYIDNRMSLGSLFFSRPSKRPVVMCYLIVCTGINDQPNL